MRTRRERIIRHIVKSAQQGNPSNKAIRNWNDLEDQNRFGNNPVKLRRNFEAALPKNYSVTEDLTIGIPGRKRKPSPGYIPGAEPPYPV